MSMPIEALRHRLKKHRITYYVSEMYNTSSCLQRGEYTYRLRIKDSVYPRYSQPTKKELAQRTEMKKHAAHLMKNGSGKTSNLTNTGNMYFMDSRDMMDFCDKFPQHIQCVWGPGDNNQAAALHELRGTNKVIRKKLFKGGKFRYRIQYKLTQNFCEEQWPFLKKKLQKMETDSYGVHGLSDYYVNRAGGWERASVFFKNEEDFVMIKLMTLDHACLTEEAVLVDELNKSA